MAVLSSDSHWIHHQQAYKEYTQLWHNHDNQEDLFDLICVSGAQEALCSADASNKSNCNRKSHNADKYQCI